MNIEYRRLLPRRLRHWLRSLIIECGNSRCRGFHLSHPVLRRLPGIFLDRTWYCSPACLEDALKMRVEAQLGTAITDLRHAPRMPFRLILLAGGRVSEEQLAHARSTQPSEPGGEDLGDALVRLGYATEDDVAAARATEAGCLFFPGEVQQVIPAHTLPLSLMQLYSAAPVHFAPVTGRLLVGFVYKLDASLLQAVAQVTGCRAEGCIMTPSAWRRQIADVLAAAPASIVRFEEVQAAASSQGLIVSMIVEHAIASYADRVHTGLSNSVIWARLAGGPRGRDLVIDLGTRNAPSGGELKVDAKKADNGVRVAARMA